MVGDGHGCPVATKLYLPGQASGIAAAALARLDEGLARAGLGSAPADTATTVAGGWPGAAQRGAANRTEAVARARELNLIP